ncbi:MAG: Ig-like domain-containing protein [bacterium]
MKTMNWGTAAIAASAGLASAAIMIGVFASGCGAVDTPDTVITITPASTSVAAKETKVFTACAADSNVVLNLPLEWTISDSSLGTIIATDGLTAFYKAGTGTGNNILRVYDQGDASGMALVQHR